MIILIQIDKGWKDFVFKNILAEGTSILWSRHDNIINNMFTLYVKCLPNCGHPTLDNIVIFWNTKYGKILFDNWYETIMMIFTLYN